MTHVIEFPFHIGDFLSGTMHMDAAETGAYIMLLVAHYQAGPDGLPDDDKKLARIARVSSQKWVSIRDVLQEKFDLVDGFWRHQKVICILKNISAKSDDAKAKALKRWNTDDAAAMPQQSHGNANHKPISNKKEKEERKKGGRAEKPPDPDNPLWWQGEVIRLNRKDYTAWLALYGGTDDQFMAWLKNRDDWMAGQAPEVRKNWFISTKKYLEKLKTGENA